MQNRPVGRQNAAYTHGVYDQLDDPLTCIQYCACPNMPLMLPLGQLCFAHVAGMAFRAHGSMSSREEQT
jgi:hypothetical protein